MLIGGIREVVLIGCMYDRTVWGRSGPLVLLLALSVAMTSCGGSSQYQVHFQGFSSGSAEPTPGAPQPLLGQEARFSIHNGGASSGRPLCTVRATYSIGKSNTYTVPVGPIAPGSTLNGSAQIAPGHVISAHMTCQ
jgi:hypothetical protein